MFGWLVSIYQCEMELVSGLISHYLNNSTINHRQGFHAITPAPDSSTIIQTPAIVRNNNKIELTFVQLESRLLANDFF